MRLQVLELQLLRLLAHLLKLLSQVQVLEQRLQWLLEPRQELQLEQLSQLQVL